MTVVRLLPTSAPAQEVSAHDRIMSALNKAIEDQTTDEAHQKSARGVIIVWYHEEPNGRFSDSFIVQGLNTLETLGLLKITADDISEYGLNDRPDIKDGPA